MFLDIIITWEQAKTSKKTNDPILRKRIRN